jgi:hypothetical protein
VFDDPVSRLDHFHRDGLAQRFADEGKTRQVIVFTHDVSFLVLLNDACRDQQASIGFRAITRGAELTGYCQPIPPPERSARRQSYGIDAETARQSKNSA